MDEKQNIQKQKGYKPIYGAIIIPITVIIFCIMIIFINYNRVAIIKDFTITETFNETNLCATYNINSDINVEKLILEFTYYDKDHKKNKYNRKRNRYVKKQSIYYHRNSIA